MANNRTRKDLSHLAPSGKYKEWICNVRVQKHCFSGVSVHVFLGDFPSDKRSWLDTESKVGTFSVLGDNPQTTGCGKCKDDARRNMKVTGIVPLTSSLIDAITAGNLNSLDENDVEPYLTKHLHWRVTAVSMFFLYLTMARSRD
jgi:tyrosinase